MFDNKQTVNNIDKRLLPSTGIIKLKDFLNFIDIWRIEDVDKLLEDLELFGIRIFKSAENNRNWLICLDDFSNNKKVK